MRSGRRASGTLTGHDEGVLEVVDDGTCRQPGGEHLVAQTFFGGTVRSMAIAQEDDGLEGGAVYRFGDDAAAVQVDHADALPLDRQRAAGWSSTGGP